MDTLSNSGHPKKCEERSYEILDTLGPQTPSKSVNLFSVKILCQIGVFDVPRHRIQKGDPETETDTYPAESESIFLFTMGSLGIL